MFDFGEALAYMRTGFKVANSRGVYCMDDDKIYFTPFSHYPNGQRLVVRMYTDSIVNNDWKLFENE